MPAVRVGYRTDVGEARDGEVVLWVKLPRDHGGFRGLLTRSRCPGRWVSERHWKAVDSIRAEPPQVRVQLRKREVRLRTDATSPGDEIRGEQPSSIAHADGVHVERLCVALRLKKGDVDGMLPSEQTGALGLDDQPAHTKLGHQDVAVRHLMVEI